MKIAIIGAGKVGCAIAYTLVVRGCASEIILVDVNADRCMGEVMDMQGAEPFCTSCAIGVGSYADAASADIVIICAGYPQKVGQSRLELLRSNTNIIADVCCSLTPLNPKALVLMVTNPLDLMVYVAQQHLALPREQIFGTGTWLDTMRLRAHIAQKKQVHEQDISLWIVGEHGDSQCVLWSQAFYKNKPLVEALQLSQQDLFDLECQTKNDAYLMIEKKGGTWYGIAACVVDICQRLIKTEQSILPLSVYVPEYDVCMSQLVEFSRNGIKRLVPIEFSEQERCCVEYSAQQLKQAWKQ